MDDVEGARAFAVTGSTYDAFMGRYSAPLAELFADAAGVSPGGTALDLGCGPGALTGVLVSRLGPNAVYACDPSPQFRDACAARHPEVIVELGRAELIPFEDDVVDHALAQLVLHFASDPRRANGFLAGVGPAGSYCVSLGGEDRERLRAELFVRCGLPDGPLTLSALARCAVARVPG